ncbi:MAG: 3-phosphoshikimate 1-carboxyvinyltransferase [Candidatus Riflebacteria bacterium]|nr:3-phosphoshikimate 1-carboxyvinyltransferase [Candidatus Riflebacteria bacterium]
MILDCGNSGTTARLLCGILCNLKGKFKLIGDESLSRRPMERVVRPLADLMGVKIKSTNGHLPIYLESDGKTKPTEFFNETGSAQVKSAILFAGLANQGKTTVIEKIASRDHTERLLNYLNFENSHYKPKMWQSTQTKDLLSAQDEIIEFNIPGDISSAAYFAVLAAITKQKITFKNILLNPLRTGFLRVLERMGAVVKEEIIDDKWEPIGNLSIEGRALQAIEILPDEIPFLIDELPILAIAMAFAKGKSTLSGAQELRVKESDRISGLISQLQKTGIKCSEKSDGYEITGPNSMVAAELDSFNDHRLAMSFAILEYCSNVKMNIKGKESVNISFPEFFDYFKYIC